MNVLIVKTSSMGDLIHTLPALTDAGKALPGIRFDWVAEEGFAEIPSWHPLVDRVIPIALRRWRKHPLQALRSGEVKKFYATLREKHYDLIIDAQGLLKSALVARFAKGLRSGLDWHSAREGLAAMFYQKKQAVDKQAHAITRVRRLFAQSIGYECPVDTPDYGLQQTQWSENVCQGNYVMFIHGTTWHTKEYPEPYWIEIAKLATRAGFTVYLPWGNQAEHDRANNIARNCHQAVVLPRLTLAQLASALSQAKAVLAVDTGLGHLSAALAVPCLSLYGPTDPKRIGTMGQNQYHLAMPFSCAPCQRPQCHYTSSIEVAAACFSAIPTEKIWQRLQEIMTKEVANES